MVDRKQKGWTRKGGPEKEDVKDWKSTAKYSLEASLSFLVPLPFSVYLFLLQKHGKFWQNSLNIERTNIGRSFKGLVM